MVMFSVIFVVFIVTSGIVCGIHISPQVPILFDVACCRREQVVLGRLMLRVCYFNRCHFFLNNDPLSCTSCNSNLTLEHMFIDCPLLNSQRLALQKHLQDEKKPYSIKNVLSPAMPPALLLQFARD